MNHLPRTLAAGFLGALLLAANVATAQLTYTWNGSAQNNVLFSGEGYTSWDPMLSGTGLSVSVSGTTANIFIFDGGAATPVNEAVSLFIDVSYANVGQLIIRNTDGNLPDPFVITSYAGDPGGTRAFRFNTPNNTFIELDETVTGTVAIGLDRALYGNLGVRIPDSGISTIHVAHPDAILDLSGTGDGFTDRGGVHAGSTTLADDRAYLRKTGPGTLDLRTTDPQGNRIKGLIVEGGTVIVRTNPQMAWQQEEFQPDNVVVNGGILHMQGFGTNSGANRGFQVGANGGTFHMTDASHAINGIVSDVPGQAGVLIKTGTTILRLAAENTYSGGTHIMEGRLRYTSDTALGTGKVTIHDGAELAPTVSSDWVLANDIDIVGNSIQFGGDGESLNLAGAIDLTGETRTVVLANSVNIMGSIGNGTLAIAASNSANTLTLMGTSSLTGPTAVHRGGLVVNSALGGDVTADRSVIEDVEWIGFVGGSGTISGNVLVRGELRPGDTSTGALTIGGDLTLAGESRAVFRIADAATFDQAEVSGAVTVDGTVAVELLDGFEPAVGESFRLVSASSPLALGSNLAFDLPALTGERSWNTADFAATGTVSVVEGLDPYEAWTATFGLTGDDALPGADPDGDGLPNHFEFLLGFNPTDSNSRLTATISTVDGANQLTLNRVIPQGTFTVETAPDVEGPWTALEVLTITTPADDYIVILPEEQDRRFYRLKVTSP